MYNCDNYFSEPNYVLSDSKHTGCGVEYFIKNFENNKMRLGSGGFLNLDIGQESYTELSMIMSNIHILYPVNPHAGYYAFNKGLFTFFISLCLQKQQ